jgi:hypothetical protein
MAGSDNLYFTGLPEGFDEPSLKVILGAYGNITQCKLLPAMPGRRAAAMVRFASMDEAKWIVDNLHGNIPQGLNEAIEVRFAISREQKNLKNIGEFTGKGAGATGGDPYGGNKGKDTPLGKDPNKGKGKCSIRTLYKGLNDAGALPGGSAMVPTTDTNTLFVAGLPYDTTDCDLYKIFGPFGPVKSVKALVDVNSGQCTGTGFVNMMEPQGCGMAIQTLNGTMMPDGTWLTVQVKTSGGKGKNDSGFKSRPAPESKSGW